MRDEEVKRYIIRNLPVGTTEAEIISLISKKCELKQIKLIEKSGSLPSCQVDIMATAVNELLITSLNGTIFKDNRIAVIPYLTSTEFEEAIKRTIILSGFNDDFSIMNINKVINRVTRTCFIFPNFKYDGSFSGSISAVLVDEMLCQPAIEYFNNRIIDNCKISCTQYKADYKKSISLNMHIRNIPSTWTDDYLKKFCGQFGEIVSCIRIPKSESYVHGFVSYKEKASLEKALEYSKNKEDGIIFEEYQSASERERSRKQEMRKAAEQRDKACSEHRVIFVGHLPAEMTEKKLRDIFNNCGTIETISISKDKRNEKKRRAYVTFDSQESAKKALGILGQREYVNKKIYGSMASPSKSTPTVMKKQEILSINESLALTEDHLVNGDLMWSSFSEYISFIMDNDVVI